jgi:hypothetical protein
LKKGWLTGGIILLLVSLYVSVTFMNLVRAYMAKPNAQHGGIQFGSTFVQISSPLADVVLAVGLIGVIFGMVAVWHSRTPRITMPMKQP